MQMNRKILGILAFSLLLVTGIWFWRIDWDERAIHKQLDQLVALVEKEGPVSTIEALGRGRKLPSFFAPNVYVEYYPGRSLPREMDAMAPAFLGVWNRLDHVSVRISRHDVEVDAERSRATSTLTANCRVVIDGSERMGDTIKYRAYWIQNEGDWLIERLVPLEG